MRMEKIVNLGKSENGKFEFLQELTKQQLETYNISSKSLIEINKSTWPFLIVKQNYFLFMEETHADFKNMNFMEEIPWEFLQDKTIQCNRRLFNFLGSFGAYIDHTKTYLSRKYGKKSNELDEFIKATSINFDKTFGYRFFCKLRDYTIHCGMPMGNITLTAEKDEEKQVYKNTVILKFGKNELLKNFDLKKWGNIVGPELQKKEDFFSVSNLVYDTMKCIQELNKILEKFNNDEIVESSKSIIKSLNLEHILDTCYCLLTWNEENGEKSVSISQIPFHLIKVE